MATYNGLWSWVLARGRGHTVACNLLTSVRCFDFEEKFINSLTFLLYNHLFIVMLPAAWSVMPCPAFSCLAISCLEVSRPASWSVIFTACIFFIFCHMTIIFMSCIFTSRDFDGPSFSRLHFQSTHIAGMVAHRFCQRASNCFATRI